MKKILALVLVALFVLALPIYASATPAPVKLKLSEVHAEGYPTTLADYRFAELVKEATEGRVEIEVFSGGSLYGSETEALEAMVIGDLGFARVSSSPVAQFVPEINAIQMPYLYKNSAHMWAVLNGEIGQTMLSKVQESGSGFIGLCWYDAGSRCFYLTKEIRTPADMAGLKIRMQDNKMMVRIVELLGATPVTGIGPADVFSSITTGIIDGAENNWPTYYNMGDYEAAKYYILDHHTRVPEILLASEAALKNAGITDADIQIIKDVAKQTQEYEIEQWKLKEVASEEAVRAAGSIIVELTPEELQLFQDAMSEIYTNPDFGGKYTETIDAIAVVGEGF